MLDRFGSEKRVGVVGAGTMGRGIALVAAAAGHPVFIFDQAQEAVETAIQLCHRDLERRVERQRLDSSTAEQIKRNLQAANSLEGLASCSLVIEAIVERLEVKTALFRSLEKLVDDTALLCTNTSSLSVTELGAQLANPGRFAGLHFFNPAPVLPLVEVVRGAKTRDEVVDQLVAISSEWGKTPVVCGSTPGFIVNRIARPFYAEPMRVLVERAASPSTIDALFKGCGGFRMGPLELTDLIGQDVNFSVCNQVYEGFFNDARYLPSPIQRELVLSGKLGRKTGEGFYDYSENATNPEPQFEAPCAPPVSIVLNPDSRPADLLRRRMEKQGLSMESDRQMLGDLAVDGVQLFMTNGATAAELESSVDRAAVFDLALDYESASHIGVALGPKAQQSAPAVAGFFQCLGMQVSFIDDIPGLAIARTVAMLVNEAADALHQGVASAEDIETAMVQGVNYPLGLLAWGDRLGAIWLATMLDNLNRYYPEGRYRCSPLLRRLSYSGGKILA